MTYTTSLPVLADFSTDIMAANTTQIMQDPTLGGRLVLGHEGRMLTSYAPFETINRNARVVICGITPGRRQAIDALIEARRRLMLGDDVEAASRSAKATSSFAGAMRANISAMLDHVGLQDKLGLATCADLFGQSASLVHYTSSIRYPVFVNGKDYNGASPAMIKSPLLSRYIGTALAEEATALPNAIWIGLGRKVAEVLQFLVRDGVLKGDRVLIGLEHASGANAERIAYFLDRKKKELLSAKTDPVRIDAGRANARSIVSQFSFLAGDEPAMLL